MINSDILHFVIQMFEFIDFCCDFFISHYLNFSSSTRVSKVNQVIISYYSFQTCKVALTSNTIHSTRNTQIYNTEIQKYKYTKVFKNPKQGYQVLYTQVSNKKYTPIPVFLSNYQLYLSTLSFAVVCCLVFHEKHVFLEEVMPCCRPLIIGAILLHGTTTNITWMFL